MLRISIPILISILAIVIFIAALGKINKILYEKSGMAKSSIDKELIRLLEDVRSRGIVSGPGAIPGGDPTLGDRVIIELANATYQSQKRVEDLTAKLNQLTFYLVVLTGVLAFLTIALLVKTFRS